MIFFNFQYYLTILRRLNSTKDGETHFRLLHGQLGWDRTPPSQKVLSCFGGKKKNISTGKGATGIDSTICLVCVTRQASRNAKDRRNTLVIYSVKYELHLMYRKRVLLALL